MNKHEVLLNVDTDLLSDDEIMEYFRSLRSARDEVLKEASRVDEINRVVPTEEQISEYSSDLNPEDVKRAIGIDVTLSTFMKQGGDFFKHYLTPESKKTIEGIRDRIHSEAPEIFNIDEEPEARKMIESRSDKVVEGISASDLIEARIDCEFRKSRIDDEGIANIVSTVLGDGAWIDTSGRLLDSRSSAGWTIDEKVSVQPSVLKTLYGTNVVAHESTHVIQNREAKRLLGDVMWDECEGLENDAAFSKAMSIIADNYISGCLNEGDKYAAMVLLNKLDYAQPPEDADDSDSERTYWAGFNETEAFAVGNKVEYAHIGGDSIRAKYPDVFERSSYSEVLDDAIDAVGQDDLFKVLTVLETGNLDDSLAESVHRIADSAVKMLQAPTEATNDIEADINSLITNRDNGKFGPYASLFMIVKKYVTGPYNAKYEQLLKDEEGQDALRRADEYLNRADRGENADGDFKTKQILNAVFDRVNEEDIINHIYARGKNIDLSDYLSKRHIVKNETIRALYNA